MILTGWNIWIPLHRRNQYLCARKLLSKLHRIMILDMTHVVRNVNVKVKNFCYNQACKAG